MTLRWHWRGLGAAVGGEDARGTAVVLDHHGLAEALLQLDGRGAHDHVGDTARRDRDDHADRFVRIILRGGKWARRNKSQQRKGRAS